MATHAANRSSAPEEIWFTRCPVPTATGLAYKLGWLGDEFAAESIPVRTLQESTPEIALRHYDHRLPTLIREGGNILAFAARAQGEPTKLVGLTWIEESQVILVRPDSGITQPAHLKGKRLALPGWTDHEIPSHIRGTSIARGMSLLGYNGALHSAGLPSTTSIWSKWTEPSAISAAPGATIRQTLPAADAAASTGSGPSTHLLPERWTRSTSRAHLRLTVRVRQA